MLESTANGRLHVLCLASNQGKAEAVRASMQAALAVHRFDVVGLIIGDSLNQNADVFTTELT